MTAQSRREISELLDAHGLRPAHHLGQNFLADPNITRKIVRLAEVGPGSRVVEIGAGTGTLTSALAGSGARVIAYEVDRRLGPILHQVTDGLDVELRFEDATDVDFSTDLEGEGWAMVANLPYNVGTPVVMDALRDAMNIDSFVVMVQKEVAERLVATPGSPAYGLPSVVAGIYSTPKLAFRVPPQVFYPRPNVESAVVLLKRKPTPAGAGRAVELARAAFGQRRKMLRSSLSEVMADPSDALTAAGISPTKRAEELSPSDFLDLAVTA